MRYWLQTGLTDKEVDRGNLLKEVTPNLPDREVSAELRPVSTYLPIPKQLKG